MRRLMTVCALASAVLTLATAVSASTLEDVKKRGMLNCGANGQLPGFGFPDSQGNWTGLDVDLCRAVAAAIFNDPTKVKFVALTAKDRFTALQSGDVDVLARNTTWTSSRDSQLGLNGTAINYFDGQGFIVRKDAQGQLRARAQRRHRLRAAGHHHRAQPRRLFPRQQDAAQERHLRCRSTRRSRPTTAAAATPTRPTPRGLYGVRLKLAKPDDHVVLPEIISKEPLAPFVRHGDDQWFDIVKWVHFAMVNAEELNVTKANVDEQMKSDNPEIKRLLGSEGNFGEQLGLTKDWAYRIVKHVGNYGEVFERNVGQGSPLKITRGLNALWTKGGIMYAPPVR